MRGSEQCSRGLGREKPRVHEDAVVGRHRGRRKPNHEIRGRSRGVGPDTLGRRPATRTLRRRIAVIDEDEVRHVGALGEPDTVHRIVVTNR